ncbi:MAG: TolC family protein [Endomicrobia bacterium]|nr:TolC family protein [Endomicrobiia bacterium]MCX7716020.1 TolC family protein [Endomicrobiia bacterium]
MKRRKFFLILIPYLWIVIYGKEITFEEGLKLLENNLQLKTLNSKVEQARYKTLETFTNWLPRVQLQTQYTKLSQPQMDLSKIPPQQRILFQHTFPPTLVSDQLYSFGFTISQLLFSSGKVYSAFRISYLNYQLLKEEYDKTKQDIETHYKETFLKTLLAKKVVDVMFKTVQISSENYKVSSELYREGRVSYLDFSSAKLNYSNAKINFLKMKNNYEIAKEGLKNLLGVNFEVEPAGELESFYANYEFEIEQMKKDIAKISEIKMIDMQKKILVNNLNLVRSEALPVISLVGSYNWTVDDYKRNFDEWDDRYNWVIILNWPIFNSGATFTKYKQAVENLKQIEFTRKSAIDGMLLQLNSLYSTYLQLSDSLKIAQESISLAEENYNVAKNYYLEGRISYLELLQAELNLFNSKINYYQTLTDYIVTCEKLKKFIPKKN